MRSWACWTERRVRGGQVEGSAIFGVEGVRWVARVLVWRNCLLEYWRCGNGGI